ncbi:MAG: hypothetical protein KC733_10615 [Candidatus Omnitrophica bacterium]|nr:hypothetical protein [Candidatus Omnitrophota bacterium]
MTKLKEKKTLAELIAPYPGKWVVLDFEETKVFGVSKNLKTAIKQAEKNGVVIPSVIKSPENDLNGFTYGSIKTAFYNRLFSD